MTIWNFDWASFWETAGYTSWYEYLALICFGAGWWFSVKNSLTTKQFEGKSFLFLWAVIAGSCCGICHHLFVDLNFKIFFYVVVLCGAISDYRVCRRLCSDRDASEDKKFDSERDWSYGSKVYKSSNSDDHRHRRHRGSGHRRPTNGSRSEGRRSEKVDGVNAGSNIEEIKFDDIIE